MKKLNDFEFYKVLRSMNDNSYYDFYRTSITKDNRKIYGTMYKVSRKLSDEDKKSDTIIS